MKKICLLFYQNNLIFVAQSDKFSFLNIHVHVYDVSSIVGINTILDAPVISHLLLKGDTGLHVIIFCGFEKQNQQKLQSFFFDFNFFSTL